MAAEVFISSPPPRSVENLPRLPSKETEELLVKHVFNGNPIQGGYLTYRGLAERVIYLKDLDTQFHQGAIDLGTKDRVWAVVKCIAVAVLVVAAAALAFFLITHFFPFGSIAADGLAAAHVVSCFPLLGSCCWLAVTVGNAIEVFKRPSSGELQPLLQQISLQSISEEDRAQMAQVEEGMEKSIEDLNGDILIASSRGNTAEQRRLEDLKEKREIALTQVQNLRKWGNGEGTVTVPEEASSDS